MHRSCLDTHTLATLSRNLLYLELDGRLSTRKISRGLLLALQLHHPSTSLNDLPWTMALPRFPVHHCLCVLRSNLYSGLGPNFPSYSNTVRP